MTNSIIISVILPSYLEEENLRFLLPRLNSVMDSLGVSYEVLVVDTISPMDGTRDVCEQNNVFYLNRVNGNLYGDAVRTGISRACGDYLLFMDADGSHPPEFIRKMYEHVEGNDIVIASRYIAGGSTDNPKILILMSLIVNILYSLALNLKCKDVSNSFKLYRATLFEGISLSCNNFDIVEEILFKIKKKHKNVIVKEVPFYFKKRMFGHTKRNLVVFIFSFIFTLIKLRFGK